jgi:hypothetical protein
VTRREMFAALCSPGALLSASGRQAAPDKYLTFVAPFCPDDNETIRQARLDALVDGVNELLEDRAARWRRA